MERIEIRPLNSLRSHPENATIFGDPQEAEEWEEIVADIKKRGLDEPIVILEDGKILSGHLRVAVFKELGRTQIHCRIHEPFQSYRAELEFLVKSNTSRRSLTREQKAYAFNRLRNAPPEKGGTKRKMGRPTLPRASDLFGSQGPMPGEPHEDGEQLTPEQKAHEFTKLKNKSRSGAGLSNHDPSADSAAECVGVGNKEARALETVFVNTDVPQEVKAAVNAGKIAPTPAAKAVEAERKRQGGEIKDAAPLKAWAENKTAKKAPGPPTEPTHEERIAAQVKAFNERVGRLFELYKELDRLLTQMPLKSVISPSEHHEWGSLIRDVSLRAWREIESVQGPSDAGKQMSLSVIAGGKS
jgi:hypothetical protein